MDFYNKFVGLLKSHEFFVHKTYIKLGKPKRADISK